MKCDWQKIGEPDTRGWQRWKCARNECRRESGYSPHDPQKWVSPDCGVVSANERISLVLSAMGASIGTMRAIAVGWRTAKAIGLSVVNRPSGGPGSVLATLLGELAVGYSLGDCMTCEMRRNDMDANGPDWCKENIDVIAGWLKESAERLGLPFSYIGAKFLIRRAVNLARLNSQSAPSARKREPPKA